MDMDVDTGKRTTAEFQAKYGKESCIFLKCDVTNEQEFEGNEKVFIT